MTSRLLASDDTTDTLNTSVTETEIASLIVPAYGLAADGAVRFTAAGDFLNNTGSADTIVFKVKLNASVALTTPAISLAASSDRRKWRMVIEILAETDSVQRLTGKLDISEAISADFALSDWSADGASAVGWGTDAETGTAAVDVSITATLGSSSANLEVTRKLTLLEALR